MRALDRRDLGLEVLERDVARARPVERRVAAAMGIAELKRSEGGDRLRLRPAREAAVIDRMLTQAIQSPERLVRQVRLRFQEAMTTTICGAVEEILGRRVLTYHSQVMFDPARTVEMFLLYALPEGQRA